MGLMLIQHYTHNGSLVVFVLSIMREQAVLELPHQVLALITMHLPRNPLLVIQGLLQMGQRCLLDGILLRTGLAQVILLVQTILCLVLEP